MGQPKPIQRLVEIFSRFPTIGPRTAARFASYILKSSDEEINQIIQSINQARERIKICSFCFNPFESNSEKNLCEICANPSRNKKVICIVEGENDLLAIEGTKKYQGIYFILGGTLSPLKKESLKRIRIKELAQRLKNPENYGLKAKFDEAIIATNFTSEGETTGLYLERMLGKGKIRATRLARGLPTGSELEYIDEETISSALEGRK